jgi:hypothetical protein
MWWGVVVKSFEGVSSLGRLLKNLSKGLGFGMLMSLNLLRCWMKGLYLKRWMKTRLVLR